MVEHNTNNSIQCLFPFVKMKWSEEEASTYVRYLTGSRSFTVSSFVSGGMNTTYLMGLFRRLKDVMLISDLAESLVYCKYLVNSNYCY